MSRLLGQTRPLHPFSHLNEKGVQLRVNPLTAGSPAETVKMLNDFYLSPFQTYVCCDD